MRLGSLFLISSPVDRASKYGYCANGGLQNTAEISSRKIPSPSLQRKRDPFHCDSRLRIRSHHSEYRFVIIATAIDIVLSAGMKEIAVRNSSAGNRITFPVPIMMASDMYPQADFSCHRKLTGHISVPWLLHKSVRLGWLHRDGGSSE